jgi:DNA-binding NarL/FixJ family response regulator
MAISLTDLRPLPPLHPGTDVPTSAEPTAASAVVIGEPSIARNLIGLVLDAGCVVDDLSAAFVDLDLTDATRAVEPDGRSADAPAADVFAPAAEPAVDRPTVAVLVDPTPRHYADAAAAGLRVVVVATEPLADDALAEAVLGGADAVVSPTASAEHLRTAVATVAAGGVVLDAQQARVVVEAARRSRTVGGAGSALSGRELDILRSIAKGESVKQTARTLGIRPKTVENVQSRLFRKLNVRNRAQAVSRAYALGLLANVVPGDA